MQQSSREVLPAGTLLHNGKYRILRFISAGGFGCTYEAMHTLFEERVAIKELYVSDFCNRDTATGHITVATLSKKPLVEKLHRKFIDEAKAQRHLNHPGIVRVTDVFEDNSTAYYVMDYIDGRSLQEMAQRPMPESEAVGYIRQVSDALAYVHSTGRLHLDIKPGNIMVDTRGRAILIDFGTSKQYDEENGQNTSTLLGQTPGFASPEQMSGQLKAFTPAADIYSLGATFYRLLSGTTPPDVALRFSGTQVAPLPGYVSASARRAIEAAMQLDIRRRPQSVAEFLAILDGNGARVKDNDSTVLAAGIHFISDTSHPEPKTKSGNRKPVYIGGASLVLLAIAAMLFVVFNGNSDVVPLPDPSPNQASESSLPDLDMVWVDGGTFRMGSEDSEAYSDEQPVHTVSVSGFSIGKYEVTQRLWKAVMGENNNPSYFEGDNLPVDKVSWDEVQEFIRKLNSMTGKRYRLPTEAEWEYAARGGNRSRGYKYSGSNDIGSVAWYVGNSGSKTHPVGTKAPNELGIYDMSGNVWEWTSDLWCSNYNSSRTGSRRVNRGGSWDGASGYCRVSYRSYDTPDSRCSDLGFRLAL